MPRNSTKKKINTEPRSVDALSVGDRTYIETHPDLSLEQLARDLSKPQAVIEDYCKYLVTRPESKRFGKLVDKQGKKKGSEAYVMTEAAASYMPAGRVTLQKIAEAVADGDDNRVANLKKLYEEQELSRNAKTRDRMQGRIHYISDPTR